MKLIIQIPCYNEAETLHVAIHDLPTHIDGIDVIETLIINDGSADNTVEEAKRLGVNHIVSFRRNRGLAYGFMAGINACLHLGADIAKLVRPILDGVADEVIGARPIDDTPHFSRRKKLFQHLGSYVVRRASGTDIPDAPSGFRAYSREAALRLNVINQYTYTLETIIQAGYNRIALTSVPIDTNPELRKSRLFKSMWAYMRRSGSVIMRSYMMYRPLSFFGTAGAILFLAGVILGIRFLVLGADGHTQSLILAAVLLLAGWQTFFMGLQADLIAANRRLLEDIQYNVRRMELQTGEPPADLLTAHEPGQKQE